MWKHRKNRLDKTTDPDFDYEAWKRKHTAFADEAVPSWVKAVTDRYSNDARTKFVCVGYCFGAPYVCSELQKGVVTAGAFAHPAFLKEHHFRNLKREFRCHYKLGTPLQSSDSFTGPLYLSCSETDHTFDAASRRKALDIMQSERKIYHYQLFSGVEHGFALRGDPDDPYQRKFLGFSSSNLASVTTF